MEADGLALLLRRDHPALLVDRFRVFLDGDPDDTRNALDRLLLRRNWHDKRR